MWGSLLLLTCLATATASCYGFGCCGVLRNMASCGCKTTGVCALTFVGLVIALFMSMTIFRAGYGVSNAFSGG